MYIRVAVLTTALFASVAGAMHSARSAATKATPTVVTIAAKNGLPHNASTLVLYRPRDLPHNLILVDPRTATATDLAAATRFVRVLRAQVGDTPAHDVQAEPKRALTTKASPIQLGLMAKLLNALATAPKQHIKKVGEVRAINVVMGPPKQP